MTAVEVREATDDDIESLALMRWNWGQERSPSVEAADFFVSRFSTWYAEHRSSHRALVAEQAGQIVGMAWLALVPRLPDADRAVSLCVDLQSVYVHPALRRGGIGAHLIRVAIRRAQELGADVVTVQAGRQSLSLYEREGFAQFERLLQLNCSATTSQE